jgi:ATP-dependent Zn protease
VWCDIVIHLAGMAAEIAAYGRTRSGGCSSDLTRARNLARVLHAKGKTQPPWKILERKHTLSFDKIIVDLDPQHGQILRDAYHMAHAILEAHGNKFYKVVSVLLTRKTASAADIESVLGPRAFVKVMGVPVAAGWFKPTFILPVVQA